MNAQTATRTTTAKFSTDLRPDVTLAHLDLGQRRSVATAKVPCADGTDGAVGRHLRDIVRQDRRVVASSVAAGSTRVSAMVWCSVYDNADPEQVLREILTSHGY